MLAQKLYKSDVSDGDDTGSYNIGDENEHNFLAYSTKDNMTMNGQRFLTFLSNAVINSIKSAQEGKPLPSVEALVCGDSEENKTLFQQMERNGQKLWNEATQGLKASMISAYAQR